MATDLTYQAMKKIDPFAMQVICRDMKDVVTALEERPVFCGSLEMCEEYLKNLKAQFKAQDYDYHRGTMRDGTDYLQVETESGDLRYELLFEPATVAVFQGVKVQTLDPRNLSYKYCGDRYAFEIGGAWFSRNTIEECKQYIEFWLKPVE